jgi:hypothetical protein
VRLAFKFFDSEGVALVNLLRDGSDGLDEMRERTRDLGIVLDESLVRGAERARTELDKRSQVISANVTRAALNAALVISDLSSWLADLSGKAGIAFERLSDAPEEKSLRTLRYELDLTSSTIEKLQGRIEELQESPTLGLHDRDRHCADRGRPGSDRTAVPCSRPDPGADRLSRGAAPKQCSSAADGTG